MDWVKVLEILFILQQVSVLVITHAHFIFWLDKSRHYYKHLESYICMFLYNVYWLMNYIIAIMYYYNSEVIIVIIIQLLVKMKRWLIFSECVILPRTPVWM